MKRTLVKFIQFGFISGIATLIDLFFLWFFTEVTGIFYLFSAVLAFLIGTTVNYSLNRAWTFKGTKTSRAKGFVSFTTIGGIGLVLTIALMALFVEIFGLHYLIARIIAAFLVLIWNFSMNSVFTFRK